MESQAAESTQRRTFKQHTRRVRPVRAPTPTDDESNGEDIGEASNFISSRTSFSLMLSTQYLIFFVLEPLANKEPSDSDNRMAAAGQSGDGPIAFFSKGQVVRDLSRILGDVSHLSTQQLEKLLNAIPEPSDPETQAFAMGNQELRVTVCTPWLPCMSIH